MPVEVLPRTMYSKEFQQTSRLSSFGFSGTIAHGAFAANSPTALLSTGFSRSLYRNLRSVVAAGAQLRLTLALDVSMQRIDSRPEESIVSAGILSSSAEALFSDHVVGGGILLPGVGYIEMMFAAMRCSVLKAVAFIRPCALPGWPGALEKCILRCTRRGKDTFEIASWRGAKTSDELKFSTHFSASFADMESGSIGRRDFVLSS